MKLKYLLIALMLAPQLSWSAEYLDTVESEVYQAPGTAKEIATRARSCIAQFVQNSEVRISDSASAIGSQTDGIQGGDVIVSFDPDQGVVIANNRVDYRAALLAHNVKSTLTLEAKDGRFRIRHTNIEALQKSTGYATNDGYRPVGKWAGGGAKQAEAALVAVSAKVAKCVQADPASDKWQIDGTPPRRRSPAEIT